MCAPSVAGSKISPARLAGYLFVWVILKMQGGGIKLIRLAALITFSAFYKSRENTPLYKEV